MQHNKLGFYPLQRAEICADSHTVFETLFIAEVETSCVQMTSEKQVGCWQWAGIQMYMS